MRLLLLLFMFPSIESAPVKDCVDKVQYYHPDFGCKNCSGCPLGFGFDLTQKTDHTRKCYNCKECSSSMYQDKVLHVGSCKPCDRCEKREYIRNCTKVENSICGACWRGYQILYKNGTGICEKIEENVYEELFYVFLSLWIITCLILGITCWSRINFSERINDDVEGTLVITCWPRIKKCCTNNLDDAEPVITCWPRIKKCCTNNLDDAEPVITCWSRIKKCCTNNLDDAEPERINDDVEGTLVSSGEDIAAVNPGLTPNREINAKINPDHPIEMDTRTTMPADYQNESEQALLSRDCENGALQDKNTDVTKIPYIDDNDTTKALLSCDCENGALQGNENDYKAKADDEIALKITDPKRLARLLGLTETNIMDIERQEIGHWNITYCVLQKFRSKCPNDESLLIRALIQMGEYSLLIRKTPELPFPYSNQCSQDI